MQELPKEMLEKELAGMELELSELRHEHKTVTDRIVVLERERFALDCKIRAINQRQLPL